MSEKKFKVVRVFGAENIERALDELDQSGYDLVTIVQGHPNVVIGKRATPAVPKRPAKVS